MTKSTTTIAILSIWLITLVSIASICKVAEIPLPLIGKVPEWDSIELIVKFCSLLF